MALANPIASDLSVMRTSLLPGLVKAICLQPEPSAEPCAFVRTGLTFVREGGVLAQEPMMAAVITGDRYPENWQVKSEPVDFFDLKGDFEALLDLGQAAAEFSFRKGEHVAMHPGQCAEILRSSSHGKRVIGHIGAIHPSLCKKMDVPANVFMVEVELNALLDGQVTSFEPLSKFPEVRRDLALIVEQSVAASALEQVIREESGQLLRDVRTFDIYAGKGIEEGHKSLAMGLTLQHASRTLKDEEVNQLIDKIINRLEGEFKASLRQ